MTSYSLILQGIKKKRKSIFWEKSYLLLGSCQVEDRRHPKKYLRDHYRVLLQNKPKKLTIDRMNNIHINTKF